MIVVDAHEDIAWNTFAYGRDYRQSAWMHRRREAGKGNPRATIGLPDSLLGRVAVVFSTLFVLPSHKVGNLAMAPGEKSYRTPQEAYQQAMTQLDYYDRLREESSHLRMIETASDLDAVLATWDDDTEISARQQGMVVLMENADPILEPKQFEEWYERGVRVVGPAWAATRYCGGTGEPGGLTALGYELLDVMASFNALLDLSHMAEESFFQALERYEGSIIASHSNPRRFRNSDRHLSDEMIRLLAERDGVMGIVLYNRFLSDEWTKGDPRLSLEVVVQAMDTICQLTGSSAHVGIGSDFDGGFGAESIPQDLETTTDLLRIADLLRERGYAEPDVEAIMGGNMLRKLRECLPG
ncbi:MAG: membrane dipeptidase [Anaerolineae bacterium]|nr:membrane dipeptidase [Anaerolineae bacterium]